MVRLNRLRIYQLILVIVLLLAGIFYFGIVIPEHFACPDGVTIWGNRIACDNETLALEEAFFIPITAIIGLTFIFCILFLIRINKLKKKDRQLFNP